MSRKPPKGKSLAEVNPELAKQWHPTKNGDLTPYHVFSSSNKKVWWKCDKGDDHEWLASLNNISRGRGCPICSGKKAVESNCLSTLYPKLAKQWHPSKNNGLNPNNVTASSNKKVWWKCDKGEDHEWKTSISHRKNGTNCPFCSGRNATKENCFAIQYPKLAKKWHPSKNNGLNPNNVTPFSSKKVWWKCDKGDDHEWQQSVSIIVKGAGCPVCSGYKLVKSNSLIITHPHLAKEWHPTKNGKLKPSDVYSGSSKKVWWKCDKGDDHEWLAALTQRKYGRDCPICRGLKVVDSNSLLKVKPNLAKQWHPTKNGKLKPSDVTIMNARKIWWICEKNHVWKSAISSRSNGTGCPSCANYGFNISKKSVFYIRLLKLYNNTHALKFGITNQNDKEREAQQKRHLKGKIKTIFSKEMIGKTALEIENRCKDIFGRKGFLSEDQMPDGFTETVKFSKENLNKIKSIVNEVLNK